MEIQDKNAESQVSAKNRKLIFREIKFVAKFCLLECDFITAGIIFGVGINAPAAAVAEFNVIAGHAAFEIFFFQCADGIQNF